MELRSSRGRPRDWPADSMYASQPSSRSILLRRRRNGTTPACTTGRRCSVRRRASSTCCCSSYVPSSLRRVSMLTGLLTVGELVASLSGPCYSFALNCNPNAKAWTQLVSPQDINFCSKASRVSFESAPSNNRRRSFALTNGALAYAGREAEGEYYRANRN